MSRSYKNSHYSIRHCAASEKVDKQIWHGRMRARQRDQLANIGEDAEAILPVHVREVSNVDEMGKEGKEYWPSERLEKTAKKIARKKAANDDERATIEERIFAKWRSK